MVNTKRTLSSKTIKSFFAYGLSVTAVKNYCHVLKYSVLMDIALYFLKKDTESFKTGVYTGKYWNKYKFFSGKCSNMFKE